MVTISLIYFYIHIFYTMLYLSLFCIGKFVFYISCAGVILPLQLHYIWLFIDMSVHNITASVLICLYMLYNISIGFTSSWNFCSVSLLCMGYYILPSHSPYLRYIYVYPYVPDVMITACTPPLRQDPTHFSCRVSGTSAMIGVGSSALAVVFNLIWLDSNHRLQLDLTHGFWLNLTHLPPDFIRLTFNALIFNSSHIIRVTFQSSFR